MNKLLSYVFVILLSGLIRAQEQKITAEDYARAEQFLFWNTNKLVYGGSVRPNWLDDDRFWYRVRTGRGTEFILVDPIEKTRRPVFDHEKLAKAIGAATDTSFQPYQLPFNRFQFTDAQHISFKLKGKTYLCDLREYRVTMSDHKPHRPDRNAFRSPDGKKAAFIRDYNLFVRDLKNGAETQITFDGVKDFGYATNNAGWIKSDRPVLLWSPDSKKIATFQHDGRGVGEMYLASTKVGHPKLEAWKYPLPGDSLIFRIHRVIINVDKPGIVRLKMEPDAHRSTITDHVANWDGTLLDAEWNEDANRFAFVSSTRDHKKATLRIANPVTGAVRDVLSETVDTFFESGFDKVNWHVLNHSDEVIWFSERSNWGHLYLYDLDSGRLKHPITKGEWTVLQVRKIDEPNRQIYFTGCGREAGDPYFEYLYRVNIDNGELQLLTPETAHHDITFSPDKKYFIDSYSTPVVPPVTVLRDLDGNVILKLEEADISALKKNGWRPPIPFTVKARDGQTDLYGLMYQPTRLDKNRQYPVLNYLYPGPQTGSVGSRAFRASRSDKQAVAELGFIVVEVDAMGTPKRSKSFHDFYYGNMGDNGIPDQIATIRQLAERYSYMDTSRVGIWGGSGGGFASTRAILQYPNFYKVAVSNSGNHDNRNYEDDWGEKWQGMLIKNPDDATNYDNQANQLLAENLKGKLLLAHGTLDSNVPPYNTLLVVDALMKANKDFDMLMFPNKRHGLGLYLMRRRWDYFVRHLLGTEPPKEYKLEYSGR